MDEEMLKLFEEVETEIAAEVDQGQEPDQEALELLRTIADLLRQLVEPDEEEVPDGDEEDTLKELDDTAEADNDKKKPPRPAPPRPAPVP